MKPLEYLYFNIYCHCIKRSTYPGDLVVRLQAMCLLSIAAGGWVILLNTVYLRLFRHCWFSSHPGAMLFALSVYLVITFLFHRIFIVQEHDQKIFNKYAQAWDSNPNKKRDLLLSLLVTVLPYLFLVSLKIFLSRP